MLVATSFRFLLRKQISFIFFCHPVVMLGCNRWRLHWGPVKESSHLIECAISSWFFLFYFPSFFYLLMRLASVYYCSRFVLFRNFVLISLLLSVIMLLRACHYVIFSVCMIVFIYCFMGRNNCYWILGWTTLAIHVWEFSGCFAGSVG